MNKAKYAQMCPGNLVAIKYRVWVVLLDAPKVSEVRSRELEVEIIDPEEQKRQDEAAAEDFFAMGKLRACE